MPKKLPASIWLFLYILFGLFAGFVVTNYAPYLYDLRTANQILLTLLLGVWLVWRWRKGNSLPHMPLTIPLLLVLCWWLMSDALSMDPRMALERTWTGIVSTMIFFALVELMRHRQQRRTVIEALFATAMVILAMTLLELANYAFGLGILANSTYSWLAYGLPARWPVLVMAQPNVNMLAAFCVMMGTLSFGWGLAARQIARYMLWFLGLLFLLPLPMTYSQSGYVALAVAAGTMLLFWLWHHPAVQRIPGQTRSRLIILGTLGAALGALAVAYLFADSRSDLWQAALQMIAQDPLTGVGYGLFGHGLRAVDGLRYEHLDHAHNLFLNITAETGLIGLGLVLWVGVALVRVGIRHWQQTSGVERIKLQAVIAALVAFSFHNLADYLSNPTLVLIVAVLVAYIVAEPILEESAEVAYATTPPIRLLPLALAGLLALYAIAFVPIHQAYAHYQASIRAKTMETALAEIHTAISLDPSLRLYQAEEAYLLGPLALADTTRRDDALAAYDAVLAQQPTWAEGWLNKAALLLDDERISEALAALEQAAQVDASGAAWLHWARLSEQYNTSDQETIISAYVHSMAESEPQVLPLASFWQQTPLRQTALERFAATQPIDVQYRIWQAHDPSRLAALVPQTPHTSGEYWIVGEWALSQGDVDTARTAFADAIARSHQDSYYISLASTYTDLTPEAELALIHAQQMFAYMDVNRLRAQWADDPDDRLNALLAAVPVYAPRQYFAQVLYDRSGAFDIPPQMRLPGPADAALQPAFDALPLLEAQKRTETIGLLWQQVMNVAPFNDEVQAIADALNMN
ncbi:O-antigen ligase family protein [Phototrophicus methaneseepsis]|uniref:O-antigen ligase family protein n=1 Tax=Phototrophicus methaneseepsis TaxID=2710758 RepID=A0A7S8IF79_9CHLR|nr:O-antigen ligase family protein [Phototrophicus methaneseepsis]QPC83307.1 O-antigen ligase family protein [Phototrophicus methaneseepsis]